MVSASMNAQPMIMLSWILSLASGCRPMASIAEPTARPMPIPDPKAAMPRAGPALPFRATLFDKIPEANRLISWHQDTALPLREKVDAPGWGPWSEKEGVIYAHAPAEALQQVLALRLHLDDCMEANGPLRVLPGTHELGVLSDEEIERHATYQEPVECLVSKGGVVAMRPLLVHASSKSRVQTPRRILHIEYSATKDLPGGLQLALA